MKSNIQRFSRAAVCLVLVCCLTVNISPIRAKAVSATAIACSVAIPVAVYVGLQALGVRQGSDSSAFNQVVSDAVDALSPEWAVNGLSTMLAVTSDGLTKTYLSKNFLQSILDYLFSSKILIDGIDLSSKYPDLTDDILDFAQSYPYYAIFINEWGKFQVFCNSNGFELVRNVSFYESTNSYYVNKYQVKALGAGKSLNANDHSVWDNLSSGGFGSLLAKGSYSVNPDSLVSYDIIESAANAIISTSEDLTLESVGHDIDTDYETYVGTGIVHDDGIPYVPVTIPSLSTDTFVDQTQAQAQAGTTSEDVIVAIIPGGVPDETTPTEPSTGDGTVVPLDPVTPSLLERLFGGVQEKLDLTYTSIQEIPELLKEFMLDVKTGFSELPTKFAEWFDNIQTSLDQFLSGQLTLAQLLGEFLSPLIDALGNLLRSIFIPSSDYITAKVEAIRAKFPFMDSIIATGEYIRDSLSGSSGPPAIYVDLTLADGDIDYGEKTLLTDFSWYAPYKGTVDSVLGAALWAFFGWRVFLRLPGLISGADGYVGEIRTLSSRSSGAGGRKKED